jgi:hypothetical protein
MTGVTMPDTSRRGFGVVGGWIEIWVQWPRTVRARCRAEWYSTVTPDYALEVLRAVREKLTARGVAHAAIFGSVARGDQTARSDIDVVVTPSPSAQLDLIDLGGIQTILDEAFGIEVDLVIEPVRKDTLRQAVAQDRVDAF